MTETPAARGPGRGRGQALRGDDGACRRRPRGSGGHGLRPARPERRRARRRSSASWPRCSRRTRDGPRSSATTSSPEPAGVRELLGLTGQFAAVDELLTGRENLEMFGRLFELSPRRRAAARSELLERFDLADAADRPARTYSGGMRRRLDLASSLLTARGCCSSTSRRPVSIRAAATRSGRSCASCAARGRRSC